MTIYKTENKELWEKLKIILTGIAFFRFDPVDGYLIKMSDNVANYVRSIENSINQTLITKWKE